MNGNPRKGGHHGDGTGCVLLLELVSVVLLFGQVRVPVLELRMRFASATPKPCCMPVVLLFLPVRETRPFTRRRLHSPAFEATRLKLDSHTHHRMSTRYSTSSNVNGFSCSSSTKPWSVVSTRTRAVLDRSHNSKAVHAGHNTHCLAPPRVEVELQPVGDMPPAIIRCRLFFNFKSKARLASRG